MNQELLNAFEANLRQINNPKRKLCRRWFGAVSAVSAFMGCTLRLRAKTFWGEVMTVVQPEVISSNLIGVGYYEEGLTRMVLECVKSGMIFFDIGAHFGYYTLLASRLVGDKGQVHAFEPSPTAFQILKLNAGKRNNVQLNPCAVFSKTETIFFNDFGPNLAAYNSLYAPRLEKEALEHLVTKKIPVKAISIDDYVRSSGMSPDFIKIDAESAEYEILLGAKDTLSKLPILSMEVGDMGIEGAMPSKDLVLFLTALGYQPYHFSAGQLRAHEIRDKYTYDNLIFLPAGRFI